MCSTGSFVGKLSFALLLKVQKTHVLSNRVNNIFRGGSSWSFLSSFHICYPFGLLYSLHLANIMVASPLSFQNILGLLLGLETLMFSHLLSYQFCIERFYVLGDVPGASCAKRNIFTWSTHKEELVSWFCWNAEYLEGTEEDKIGKVVDVAENSECQTEVFAFYPLMAFCAVEVCSQRCPQGRLRAICLLCWRGGARSSLRIL